MAKRWQAPPGGGHVVADYYIGNTHITERILKPT